MVINIDLDSWEVGYADGQVSRPSQCPVAGAWRPRRRAPARHQPSAVGGQGRHGISRLRLAHARSDFGRECRPDAGRQALRARKRIPVCYLCHVVDIKAAIQEYILRSWSLVKLGTTANQKKLFFNLRKTKSKISAVEEGDLRPDQVKIIARRLGVTEQDVVDMNRRLGGDVSLNAPIREEGDSEEWQDRLVDQISDQETRLAESEESDNRRKALGASLSVLTDRERRIFEARRLADDPITLEDLASEFGVSRERVRQIEVRAFEKVQRAVKTRVAAIETWTPLSVH